MNTGQRPVIVLRAVQAQNFVPPVPPVPPLNPPVTERYHYSIKIYYSDPSSPNNLLLLLGSELEGFIAEPGIYVREEIIITNAGAYQVDINLQPQPLPNNFDAEGQSLSLSLLAQVPPPVNPPFPVTLQPHDPGDTLDEVFWKFLKVNQLRFKVIYDLVHETLCAPDPSNDMAKKTARRLPFIGVEEYSIVKFGVEAYVMSLLRQPVNSDQLGTYLQPNAKLGGVKVLDYYNTILQRLDDAICTCHPQSVGSLSTDECFDRFRDRLVNFSNMELIWSYWMEQGMLVQSMNAIELRFQNVRHIPELDALSRFDTSPLLPLSNLLWGYIQDKQHTLTLHRRAYEYDHEYGLTLVGNAVPQMSSFDSRSRFLEAFHTLLHKCAVFYREKDDTTRVADAFGVLNALREVHLLLAEGNHNAYYNLTTTARCEMLTQQYLLAQPEMREFLGGRIMVPYAETWMDRVDTVNNAMGWHDTSVTYFADLANFGELLLLSIRYGNWSQVIDVKQADNWATAFRNETMRYIHAYRTVTGADLSADTLELREVHFAQPSMLMQNRRQALLSEPGRMAKRVPSRAALYAQ